MQMDITTAFTIITVASLFLGSIVALVRSFKSDKKDWKASVESLHKELESYKHNNQLRFAEFENKITLLSIDAEKIADVKAWVTKIEKTISDETSKLESKFDELMRIIISLMGKQ